MTEEIDLVSNLERLNKRELRELVRAYRFLALSYGTTVEQMAEIEKSARLVANG